MNTEPQSIFDLAPKRLKWLSDRQKAVSENIANADVAGYRAKDVESFSNYMEKTRANAVLPSAKETEAEVSWSADLSGNNVVLEEQMMEVNANAGQFRLAANLYRKAHELVQAVSGRR